MSSKRQRKRRVRKPPELATLNRAFLDSALDCIIMMDATGRVREFNPASERVFGFARAEAVGKELAELIIPPRMRERHRQGLARYLKTGKRQLIGKLIEIEALRRDGEEILVQLAITALEIDGWPIFTAYLRDITERRRAEEQFRAAVEAAPSGMIMADKDGRIVLLNSHAERLFGYSHGELIGQPVEMLVPERLRAKHQALRSGYMHQPSARPMGAGRYLLALRKDGSEVPVEIGLNPIETSQGVMVLSAIVDITERVRAERRRAMQYAVANLLAGSWTLAEAALQVLKTVASGGDWAFAAIWVYDEAAGGLCCRQVWHEASKRVKKFADLSLSITLAKGKGLPGRVWDSKEPTWVYDVTRDSNFPRAPNALEADLHGGFAFPLFSRGEIDGIIELFSHRVVEPDEDLLQMVKAVGSQIGLFISREATERKLSQEQFRLATEASPSGIVLVNNQGRIVLVNAHVEELFGYNRDELLGKPVEILVPDRFGAVHPAHRTKFLASPQVRVMGAGRELFARRKDGTEFPVEIGLSPIQTPQGILVLASVVDISARKAADEEARIHREEINRLTRISLMGEMSAAIAHELNQPLGGIVTNANVVQRLIDRGDVNSSKIREIMVDIEADGRRASEVLHNIRNTVKKGTAARQRINVNDVVMDVVHMVQPDAGAHSCELKMSLANNLATVEADRIQIQQILINLVNNAFDAMRKTPVDSRKVEITTRLNRDRTICVSVRDHGVGIPEEARDRLFEQFFTTKEEGLGMGLAIVRSIVESHAGTIVAENAEGGGARFYFTLPVRPTDS